METTGTNLSSYLAQDHDHCDDLFKLAQRAVCTGQWGEAKNSMAAFRHALERHLLVEERILFPAFENAIGRAVAPTAAMRTEHLRIRGMAQRMDDAVRARDADAFVKHAGVLLLLVHEHAEKEEGVLYPMIERVLQHRCADLVSAMRAFGTHDAAASAA